jgi:hypothetical protein
MAAPERRYVLFTDDEAEAWAELRFRRAEAGNEHGPRYRGWDMAAVAELENPPETQRKFCVFQIEGNK